MSEPTADGLCLVMIVRNEAPVIRRCLASARSLPAADDLLAHARREGPRYVVPGPEGNAVLTLLPSLQESLARTLADYQTPWAASSSSSRSTARSSRSPPPWCQQTPCT